MAAGEPMVKIADLRLPGNLRLRVSVRPGELVGIALKEPAQRQALARKLLGYDADCAGVAIHGQEIWSLALWQLAKIRARVGANLSSAELLAAPKPRAEHAPRRPVKPEKAKTLLAGFQEHMEFLLFGYEAAARPQLLAEAGERFIRLAGELGLRHTTRATELRPEEWRLFYLAAALAVGRDFVILDSPLEGFESARMIRAQATLETFRRREGTPGFMLSATRNCIGAGLCARWIG